MKSGYLGSLTGLCVRLLLMVSALSGAWGRGAELVASPETTRRLEALEKGFQEAAEREGGTGSQTALDALGKGYAGAVDRAMVNAIKEGDTEAALVLRSERQRLEKGEAVPETDAGNEPASLKTLRTTYRDSRQQIEWVGQKNFSPCLTSI